VPLFYREEREDRGKRLEMAGKVREPEGQGPVDVGRASSFVKTDLRPRLAELILPFLFARDALRPEV
jgi:hypothetical protein